MVKAEAYLQSNVLKLCTSYRLLAYHTHDSRRSQPGFPDLVIVGPGGVLFVELKSEAGKTTADQEKWLAALNGAGVRAELWRPADLYSGRINDTLRDLAAKRRPRSVTCPSCTHKIPLEAA
ncbi:VRR-NUC domain-containing protein [Micromonospora sp. C51]|uniref:VRR-NUC domain-containing protein n=1 Tax=Micromonospora sp. C51 TaxID=2824879 RepID=UPI001B37D443|nr:VRR-NUC domain-containing protein [Micromonospora sp. C51]MBQ1047785.1 VRR-NUC domain-containing protein [Micromonospora sp. C51]